jgi:hypothetical protein
MSLTKPRLMRNLKNSPFILKNEKRRAVRRPAEAPDEDASLKDMTTGKKSGELSFDTPLMS